jgi:hypothetical protein
MIINPGSALLASKSKLLFPFYGPVPLGNEYPFIEFETDLIEGNPTVVWGTELDASDFQEIDQEINLGYNTISIPADSSTEFLYFGIQTGVGEYIRLNSLNAEVRRYLSSADVPAIEAGESASILINGSGTLSKARARFNDAYPG